MSSGSSRAWTARAALSMGAYGAIPRAFARIHPKYLSPSVSTIWMGIVSIVFYVGLTLVGQDVLGDTIAAVGLMIAFYYGLTGFACVWFYRKTCTSNTRDLFMQGIIPFVGGAVMLSTFVYEPIRWNARFGWRPLVEQERLATFHFWRAV